jgi:hypothetical protein
LILHLLKYRIQELLGVLLFSNVGGVSIQVLEGETEFKRIVVGSLGQLQVGNQLLELMEHIVIDLVALVLLQVFRQSIIDTQQVVSERGDHKELLKHGVHIANASQIPQSHILLHLV